MNKTTDNHFGSCLWGVIRMKGTWTGWCIPTADVKCADGSYITTRPYVNFSKCMDELKMLASLADIMLREGTRVRDQQ